MKRLLFVLLSVAAFAQTAVDGPVQIRGASSSESGAVELLDQAQHYAGFIAPALVTQIVVSSATAASPMVLTLANPRPTTVKVGGTVTLSGALGSGCSGMNDTHPVSAVGASTITITFNGVGCAYTGDSADLETHIYWELPAQDGITGDCVAWSAPYVLAFATCGSGSSGANQFLSNLLSPTAINEDLLPDTDDALKLGDVDRWYQIAANRFEGSCSLCDAAVNFMKTRKVEIYDQGGASDLAMSIVTDVGTAGERRMEFIDNAGDPMLTLERMFMMSVSNLATFDMSVVSSGGSFTVGTNANPWFAGYFSTVVGSNIQSSSLVSGAITDVCATTGGILTISGCPVAGGANQTLSNLTSPTAVNQDLLPGADDTYKLGNAARWFQVSANRFEGICSGCTDTANYAITRKLELYDVTGAAVGWNMKVQANGLGPSNFQLLDNLGDVKLRMETADMFGTTNNATWDMNLLPKVTANRSLGNTSLRWLKGWFGSIEAGTLSGTGGGALTLDSSAITALGAIDAPALASSSSFVVLGTTAAGGNIRFTTGGTNQWTLDTSGVLRPSSGSKDLGSSGVRVSTGYFTDLNISGTCTGCTAGANTTLSNLGTTAINAALTPNADATYGVGTSTARFGQMEATTFAARSASGGTRRCQMSGGSVQCVDGSGNAVFTVSSLTGAMLSAALGGSGTRCLQTDNSGNIAVAGAGCSTATGTVTSIATTGPIGGGTITTTGTITCTTCVTTAGGQSIAGTTTLSTASISTAISGTFNMSGNMTTTGNFYNRSFSGSGISCAGVGDGWTGWDTSGQFLIMCAGGNRYRVNLASY